MDSVKNPGRISPDLTFALSAVAAGAPVRSTELFDLVTRGLVVICATPQGPAPELTRHGLIAATEALASLSPLMRAVTFAADMARQELPDCCDRVAGVA